jgi:hypothetical protein
MMLLDAVLFRMYGREATVDAGFDHAVPRDVTWV